MIGLLVLASLSSCHQQFSDQDHQDLSANQVPLSRSFELSAPETIEWEIVNPDSIPSPKTYPLDLNKLPS